MARATFDSVKPKVAPYAGLWPARQVPSRRVPSSASVERLRALVAQLSDKRRREGDVAADPRLGGSVACFDKPL